MPALPLPTANSTESKASPIYVCYFNQSSGVVSATNCTLQDHAVTKTSAASEALTIILLLFWNLVLILSVSYLLWLCLGNPLLTWYINWISDPELGNGKWARRIMFWRKKEEARGPATESLLPAAQPETTSAPSAAPIPASAPAPEPAQVEAKVPDIGTPEYYDHVKTTCTPSELLLWDQITFPTSIKAGFEKIHLPAATIDTVKSFSIPLLKRREEFAYGVLANNIMPGLLLYGPPGTGKTQLVKALAKFCDTRVLSISAGHIHGKYWGESETAVATAFSLARKLSPCILFVDEADAMLHERHSEDHDGGAHRNTLTQFLAEWDGFSSDTDKPTFVVLATNRPSDLDEAVLRRAPKRIAIGVPTYEDRIAILKIHLDGETLAEDISIEDIAKKTDKFTGSDLKNLCIAAAYAWIFENDVVSKDTTEETVEDKLEPQQDVEVSPSASIPSSPDTAVEELPEDDFDHDDHGHYEHDQSIPLLPLPHEQSPHTKQTPSTPPPPPLQSQSPAPPAPPSSASDDTLVSEDPLTDPTSTHPNPKRVLAARHFAKATKDITPTYATKSGMSIGEIFEKKLFGAARPGPGGAAAAGRPSAVTDKTIMLPRSRVPSSKFHSVIS